MFIGELVRHAVERGGGTGIGNLTSMGEKVFNYFECWNGDGEINLSAITRWILQYLLKLWSLLIVG